MDEAQLQDLRFAEAVLDLSRQCPDAWGVVLRELGARQAMIYPATIGPDSTIRDWAAGRSYELQQLVDDIAGAAKTVGTAHAEGLRTIG